MKEDKLGCVLRSIFTFWNNPNLEEFIEKTKAFKDISMVRLGKCDQIDLFLVNGDNVKTKYFDDFVEGGNDAVYGRKSGEVEQFMPENQIWIDANVDVNSIPYICFHELWERDQMANHGLNYEQAHEKANTIEMKLRSIKAFENRRNILKFPRIKQPDENTCGHTAIAMILQYYGIDKTVDSLLDTVQYSEPGLSDEEIVSIISKIGLKTQIKNNITFEEFKSFIDEDIPLLMDISTPENQEGHYVVGIGYTLEDVIFADPTIFYKSFANFDSLSQNKLFIINRPNNKAFEREKTIPLK